MDLNTYFVEYAEKREFASTQPEELPPAISFTMLESELTDGGFTAPDASCQKIDSHAVSESVSAAIGISASASSSKRRKNQMLVGRVLCH